MKINIFWLIGLLLGFFVSCNKTENKIPPLTAEELKVVGRWEFVDLFSDQVESEEVQKHIECTKNQIYPGAYYEYYADRAGTYWRRLLPRIYYQWKYNTLSGKYFYESTNLVVPYSGEFELLDEDTQVHTNFSVLKCPSGLETIPTKGKISFLYKKRKS